MPDHLHALFGVDGHTSLGQLIRDYKSAKITGVRWQRNFFDHRLRHGESLAEKFAYICQNPVRAGLIRSETDWPFIFIPGTQGGSGEPPLPIPMGEKGGAIDLNRLGGSVKTNSREEFG